MINIDNSNNGDKADDCRIGSKEISRRWGSSLKKGEILSILFAGVGGQGIILATAVIANAAINAGFDVKVSEVHGMAQRGGSVEGSVRVGRRVFSPTINKADFIIALEKLEGLRNINRLARGGYIIINDYKIYPSTVFTKDKSYPQEIEAIIGGITQNSLFINAAVIASNLKETRASNIVLIGLLSKFLPFEYDCWIEAIKKVVPAKAMEINISAFDLGKDYF